MSGKNYDWSARDQSAEAGKGGENNLSNTGHIISL